VSVARIFAGGSYIFGGLVLAQSSQSNATDHALAAIASILDHSEAHRGTERSPTLMPEADGYTKIGPGPLAAIRFRWTVRRAANDEYFVDEMIGENSTGTANGPMAKEAAVKLVDDREAEARRRFEQFRSEMTGRTAHADRAPGASGRN
jgi:hypothetical protein